MDLRGRSFVHNDLAGAALRSADLRGADFSHADLRGADLGAVRTGMTRAWATGLVIAALALSIAAGVVAGRTGQLLRGLLTSGDDRRRALGVILTAELVVFLVTTVWKGLDVAARVVLPIFVAIAITAGAVAITTGVGTGEGAIAVLLFALLAAAIVALGSLARAVAGTAGDVFFLLVAVSGALSGSLVGGGLAATAIAVDSMIAGRRALRGEGGPLTRISAAVASWRGTRFRGADLSGATFASAHLSACDFRGAILDRARFDGASVKLCRFDRGRAPT